MKRIRHTDEYAYDIALEAVNNGQLPACIGVEFDGRKGVWTSQKVMPPAQDKFQTIMQVIILCMAAHRDACAHGYPPV